MPSSEGVSEEATGVAKGGRASTPAGGCSCSSTRLRTSEGVSPFAKHFSGRGARLGHSLSASQAGTTDRDGQKPEQTWALTAEVAAAYGVSIDSIRRPMKQGGVEASRARHLDGAVRYVFRDKLATSPLQISGCSTSRVQITTAGVQITA